MSMGPDEIRALAKQITEQQGGEMEIIDVFNLAMFLLMTLMSKADNQELFADKIREAIEGAIRSGIANTGWTQPRQ